MGPFGAARGCCLGLGSPGLVRGRCQGVELFGRPLTRLIKCNTWESLGKHLVRIHSQMPTRSQAGNKCEKQAEQKMVALRKMPF